MGITNPQGVKKYFVAAFPRYENERNCSRMNEIFSACGKTNLSMLRPKGLPGYQIECVGKFEEIVFC